MIAADYQGEDLVFIVGSPRSGTTWLQRLLATHPELRTGQESGLFDAYLGPQLRAWERDLNLPPSSRSTIGMGCYLSEDAFMRALRAFMLELLEPMVGDLGPGEIFVEKTPSHALYLPEIARMLPRSRVVHLLRDGRAVSASLLAASRSWGSDWAPSCPRAAARMWASHVSAARQAAPLLGPERFHEVRYEELHRSPLRVLQGVRDFLRIEWSEDDLRAAVKTNSAAAMRTGAGTPIEIGGALGPRTRGVLREPDGFVRKAQLDGWRSDLSRRERLQVWLVARRIMQDVGYPWRFPW